MLKRFLFLWAPVFLWMGIIFFFSTRQRVGLAESQAINFLIFKFFHLVEYSFLYFLLHRAFKYEFHIEGYDVFVTTFFVVLLFAFSDEIHQTFIPTREGRLRDVIIDGAGASLTWIFLYFIAPRLPNKLKNLGSRWQLM